MASGWDCWLSLEPDGQQVPALSLTFTNPKVTRICPQTWLQWDSAASPECWARLGVPGGGTAGVPPRDGDSDVKAKLGFLLFFFLFLFLLMIVFTVT